MVGREEQQVRPAVQGGGILDPPHKFDLFATQTSVSGLLQQLGSQRAVSSDHSANRAASLQPSHHFHKDVKPLLTGETADAQYRVCVDGLLGSRAKFGWVHHIRQELDLHTGSEGASEMTDGCLRVAGQETRMPKAGNSETATHICALRNDIVPYGPDGAGAGAVPQSSCIQVSIEVLCLDDVRPKLQHLLQHSDQPPRP
jgi:hypothetical protein